MFGDSLDNDGDGLKDEDGRVGLRKVSTATPGALGMLTPPDGFRHDAQRIATVAGVGRLVLIPTTTDPVVAATQNVPFSDEIQTLTYSDNSGRTELFKNLRWVALDDASPGIRNDTIWTRVLSEEGTTPTAYANLDPPRQEEIKILAIVEIRKKVMAETDLAARIARGKATVGGCWDNAK